MEVTVAPPVPAEVAYKFDPEPAEVAPATVPSVEVASAAGKFYVTCSSLMLVVWAAFSIGGVSDFHRRGLKANLATRPQWLPGWARVQGDYLHMWKDVCTPLRLPFKDNFLGIGVIARYSGK